MWCSGEFVLWRELYTGRPTHLSYQITPASASPGSTSPELVVLALCHARLVTTTLSPRANTANRTETNYPLATVHPMTVRLTV